MDNTHTANQAVSLPPPVNPHSPGASFRNPLLRVVNPNHKQPPSDYRKILTALIQGIDEHHWGSNYINTDTGELRKASWPCRVETYNRHEREWRTRGRYKRQYTRAHFKDHLTGAATDFFCGIQPSSRRLFQFAVIDGDNRCPQFAELDATISRVFPKLKSEPSTGGKGTHRLIKIGFYPIVPSDREMHDMVVGWSSRLTAATRLLARGSTFEVKGACCYWDDNKQDRHGGVGGYVMGTLVRLPRTLSLADIKGLPIYRIQDVEDRIARIESLAGIKSPSTPSQTDCVGQLQSKYNCEVVTAPTPLSRYQEGTTTLRNGEGITNSGEAGRASFDASSAFNRMVHAKCEFVKQHKRLPETAEALCDYYESLDLNTGDRTASRVNLARRIIENARQTWVEILPVSMEWGDYREGVLAREGELKRLVSKDVIKGLGFRVGVKHIELAAFEVVLFTLNHRDGFASRDGVKGVLTKWVDEGVLPSLINNEKLAAFKKVLLAAGLLEVVREHHPPGTGGRGTAASYKPLRDGYGWEMYLEKRRKEEASTEVLEVLSATG